MRLAAPLAACAAVAACFPAYEIASGAGDSGADAAADGAVRDSTAGDASDAAANDATNGEASADAPGADSGPDSGADAITDAQADAFPPYDGPPPDAMTVVQAGTYGFWVDTSGSGSAFLDASAALTHAFAIDQTEVTVGRFTAWVDAGMPAPGDGTHLDPGGPYDAEMIWSSAWNGYATDTGFENASTCSPYPQAFPSTYTSNDPRAPTFPVTCVNWFQAVAFCAFESKRLPTETEWRIVAQGEGARTTYPWGDTPDPPNCAYATMDLDSGCGFPVPVATASMGHTPDGVYDLAGSLPEIVWDRVPMGSGYTYPAGTQTDYAGLATSVSTNDSFIAIESFFASTDFPYNAMGAQVAWNGSIPPPAPAVMGFRCARSL